jgi:uncharacterized membrane protein
MSSPKRNFALVTGILQCIFGGFNALVGLILAAASAPLAMASNPRTWADYNFMVNALIVVGVFILIFAIANIIIGGFLCRAKCPTATTGRINGLLITSLVLNIFGSLITLIFAIVALCCKDEVVGAQVTQVQCASSQVEFDMAHARLKQYLADGIITEEQYKQKVHELTDKYLV